MERPTYKELIEFVKKNGDIIFVRACVNGKWKNVTLNSLTPMEIESFIQQWYDEGRFPHIMLES